MPDSSLQSRCAVGGGRWSLGVMTTPTTIATMAWRWILITAELLVVAYVMSALMAGRAARHPSGAFAVMGIAAFVAWVFLFLGSPFFVRSQRWLAILGWCISVAALFFSGSPCHQRSLTMR